MILDSRGLTRTVWGNSRMPDQGLQPLSDGSLQLWTLLEDTARIEESGGLHDRELPDGIRGVRIVGFLVCASRPPRGDTSSRTRSITHRGP
jgi:hypothetical protein